MTATNRFSSLLLGACALILPACHCESWSEKHTVPVYSSYSLSGNSLSNEDGEKLRQIVMRGALVQDNAYRQSDTAFFGKRADGTGHDQYSIYLKERIIFEGDWLDVRSLVLEDKTVDCVRISRSDAKWIEELIRSRKSGAF